MAIHFNTTAAPVNFLRRGSFWLSVMGVLVSGVAVVIGQPLLQALGCGGAVLIAAAYTITSRARGG